MLSIDTLNHDRNLLLGLSLSNDARDSGEIEKTEWSNGDHPCILLKRQEVQVQFFIPGELNS